MKALNTFLWAITQLSELSLDLKHVVEIQMRIELAKQLLNLVSVKVEPLLVLGYLIQFNNLFLLWYWFGWLQVSFNYQK